MQEPYRKGAATPSWPRVLRRSPRGGRRSVDRGTGGQGIEQRKHRSGCRPCPDGGKATLAIGAIREPVPGPALSKTPSTPRNNRHENRETSSVFPSGDRSGKANNHKPDM